MISSKDLTNVILLGLLVLALLLLPLLPVGMPGVGLPIVKARPALREGSNEPCEELICNGGFETIECWTIGDTTRPAGYSDAVVRSGSWSMRLGITYLSDVQGYSSIYQEVTIPGDAVSAALSFWYYPVCNDTSLYDWQETIIFDQSWGIITRPMPKICSNSQTWTHHTFDLTPYKGQTVILYFNVYNDGVGNLKTAMYLDDVSIQVCRTMVTSTPTATPTVTGTSTPTVTGTPPTVTVTPTITSTPSTPEASYTYLPLVRKEPTPTPAPTATPTPTPTLTPTPGPSPTLTPTPEAPVPEPGRWGGPSISFTVTEDGRVGDARACTRCGCFNVSDYTDIWSDGMWILTGANTSDLTQTIIGGFVSSSDCIGSNVWVEFRGNYIYCIDTTDWQASP